MRIRLHHHGKEIVIYRIRQPTGRDPAYVFLLYDHELRRAAADRFLRERLRYVTYGGGSMEFDIPDELMASKPTLKVLESLLNVDLKTKDIKEALAAYGEGRKTLEETYNEFLPTLISESMPIRHF